MELAKGEGIAVVLVGHVTKDGSIAGPRTLEHLVDAVIDLGGERGGVMRLVRASKNRFGSTDELGVLEMGEDGLGRSPTRGVRSSPSTTVRRPAASSRPTLEGTRPLLVEVQALVSPAGYGTPARRASGIDPTRLALLLAVLGRRAGVGLGTHDVYANLAGGLTVAEPGLDLAVALALASSLRDRPIDARTVAVGEVGLLGELRPVSGHRAPAARGAATRIRARDRACNARPARHRSTAFASCPQRTFARRSSRRLGRRIGARHGPSDPVAARPPASSNPCGP